MASNKVYRERNKVTPENVTCAYYKKKEEPGLLFPVFTRDLYFSVFPAPIPDRRINDGNPADHTTIFKVMARLGSGKIGKHSTAMRKDFAKYSCTKPLKQDVSMMVILTEMESKGVDYIDAARAIEPFLLGKHPNPFLCRVLLHFRDRVPYQVENYYYASEYWHEGAPLSHLLQENGRISEDEARFYLSQLQSAIEDVHNRGKIFRCLSLYMLHLDPNGHLKVCPYTMCDQNVDCGKPCDPMASNCGDQFYASPEIVFGVDVKPAADWWSFGAIMYHLLTGQTPFSGCTLGELGKAITEEDPSFPPHLSTDAIDLIQKLLHKDPRRRAGWGDNGACAVKNHPFWGNTNWMMVSQRYQKPPFTPADRKHGLQKVKAAKDSKPAAK